MRKIIVAIDSFKGCLTSKEANEAAAEGVRQRRPDAEVTQIAVSDGGEGWLEAFQAALGGEFVEVCVRDPLMRPVISPYLTTGDRAVIEMAKASGLTLLAPEERNPMVATSYGTGQLIADAVRRGCKEIIVGLGGSATSDCGIGMLRAIIDAFADKGLWDDVRALDGVRFTIATDVTNPLCGEHGAAQVFARQKFAVKREPSEKASPVCREQRHTPVVEATPERIRWLDARARMFAEKSALHFGYDRQDSAGAGAAGGLGYAFLQYLNADSRPGIDLLLEAIHFDDQLRDAGTVITGEGSADRQTLMGKLPFGILRWAKARHVPVALVAGRVSDRQLLLDAGFSRVECINPPGLLTEDAMEPGTAKRNIAQTVSLLA